MIRQPLMHVNKGARWPWVGLLLCYPLGAALIFMGLEVGIGFDDEIFFFTLFTLPPSALGYFTYAVFDNAVWASAWSRSVRLPVAFGTALVNTVLFVVFVFWVSELLY